MDVRQYLLPFRRHVARALHHSGGMTQKRCRRPAVRRKWSARSLGLWQYTMLIRQPLW